MFLILRVNKLSPESCSRTMVRNVPQAVLYLLLSEEWDCMFGLENWDLVLS